jgi:coenzyme PQQ synthesis protein D (PqqD)
VSLSNDTRFRRTSDALHRRVGADVLVTRPGDPQMHALSGGATAVWDGLDASPTLPELVDRLAVQHGMRAEQIGDEVEECLEMLLGLGVVEAGTGPYA